MKDGPINISKLTFEPGSDQHTDEALSHETIEHLFRQQHFKDNTKKIERFKRSSEATEYESVAQVTIKVCDKLAYLLGAVATLP